MKQFRQKPKFGVPWSHAELAALEPYVKGRIKGKYRNSRHAARSYLADMEAAGVPSRRTPQAVWLRICRRRTGLAWEFTAGWSREELRVIDRHVRGLARANGLATSSEVDACMRDLRHLRAEHRGAVWARVERTRDSVLSNIRKRARVLRRRYAGCMWTEQENRIVEPFAQALARGRSGDMLDLSRRCREELERLRRRNPAVAARRRVDMVWMHIRQRANELGWSVRWTPAELRILDPCIRALSRGEFRSGAEAAAAFLARIERRRRSVRALRFVPRRSRGAVVLTVFKRGRALGLPLPDINPTGRDRERIEWYAGQVARGRIPSASEAARRYLRECTGRDGTTSGWVRSGHGLRSVVLTLQRRARLLGRPPVRVRWGPEENAIFERHVRRVAAGEFASVLQAARACGAKIENLHRQHPNANWSRVERTLGAVKTRMHYRLDSMGARWAARPSTGESRGHSK